MTVCSPRRKFWHKSSHFDFSVYCCYLYTHWFWFSSWRLWWHSTNKTKDTYLPLCFTPWFIKSSKFWRSPSGPTRNEKHFVFPDGLVKPIPYWWLTLYSSTTKRDVSKFIIFYQTLMILFYMEKASYHMGIQVPCALCGFWHSKTHLLMSIRLEFLGQEQPLRWCLSLCGAPAAAGSPLTPWAGLCILCLPLYSKETFRSPLYPLGSPLDSVFLFLSLLPISWVLLWQGISLQSSKLFVLWVLSKQL